MSLNIITIQGRLCADPEMRSTSGGKTVANVTLAVDRDYQKGEADFIPIVAWNQTGTFLTEHFTKGQMALITGRLQIRSYTDKEGNKRTVAEVVADRIHFCGPKQNTGKPVEVEDTEPDDDGDIPF